MDTTFGERLREARIAKKFTQKELALKIGAKHNSISDWENDKNKPDPDTIELLCGILDVSPNYIIGSTKDVSFSPSEKVLVEKYRHLDVHGKKMVDFVVNEEFERVKTDTTDEDSEYIELAARGGKIRLDKKTAAALARSAKAAPNSSQNRDIF